MKKAVIILSVIFLSLSFTACKGPVAKNFDKISELRTAIYEGGDETMKVTVLSGYKEEPFIIDGIASGMDEFTLIKIVPSQFDESDEYSYEITFSDNSSYNGAFAIHPFEDSYSALVSKRTEDKNLCVKIICDGNEKTFELNSPINEKFIDADKALEIALKKLSERIKSFSTQGLDYEIYCRLTADPISNTDGFYWYVAFVGEGGVTFAVLIEPETMDIVAIRD